MFYHFSSKFKYFVYKTVKCNFISVILGILRIIIDSNMESATVKKPKTMAELMPGLSGILSKNAIHSLTAKKQPRPTMTPQTRTAGKVYKPLTIAEMRADIQALKIRSPRRVPQGDASNKKKNWNSSVKVDKKISHTAEGQLKNNPVRKVLNFQPRTKVIANSRVTMLPMNADTPKFPKPESRAKKSIHVQAPNIMRISGIFHMPETPVVNNPMKNRKTLANKENISHTANMNRKSLAQQKFVNRPKLIVSRVPDTPLSNESWKSSCDASFLEKEKEINDVEEKAQAVAEEQTLENIAEVSPPVSTPFKEYRNVTEYFNNSSELESSALYNDNTIMCFDKPAETLNPKVENKREESVIVSLCDLLNNAKVTVNEKVSTELDDLLEVEKQTQSNIKMIENGIQVLNNIKESQLKSLIHVQKIIKEKRNGRNPSESDNDKTLISNPKVTPKTLKKEKITHEKSPILGKPCSVIKSPNKSPTYKIPRKNLCLRKKVLYKSMPNVSNGMHTPNKDIDNRALNMYMKMKENMNFLNTPLVKHKVPYMPDTPAVTSHNLQMQLDKLYGGS